MKPDLNKNHEYLKKVAKRLMDAGYRVERPTEDDEHLDIWGKIDGRECFVEIYVFIYECNNGVNGVWTLPNYDNVENSDDDDTVEVYLNCDGDLQGEYQILTYLDNSGLNPIRKGNK